MRRAVLFAALGLLGLAPGQARAEPVALTFDDLPQLALTDAVDYARATNVRLLAGLRRHRLPAVGFVVGSKLEGPERPARTALLEAWLKAGRPLGNHTWDHASLNRTPLADYIADVQKDDDLLRPLMAAHHERPRWFRHPYLETGATADVQHGFEGWLKAHGYRVAPVTLENADWMFAYPYDEAVLKGDKASAERIRLEYLDYTAKCVVWYREAALELLGRRPALVFLLHGSRLNADSVDALAYVLRHNGLKPASLERAMRDKAYSLPDEPPEEPGDEWLSRWAHELGKTLPWSAFPQPPADIAAAEMRLDKDP
ncbi:MAG TPA: polysaccharide deacetylase family protein [Caulobacteraceae bacterium]|jgi:peptidoglycan/xylan/chitin deacetylase (PgdA/CDA1 family)